MDNVGKTIGFMLAGAVAVGIFIMFINPQYRKTAADIWRGETTNSPIWISNAEYYPDIKADMK